MPNNNEGVFISNEQIFEKVQELSDHMSDVKSAVEHVRDHETRIRSLEKGRLALFIVALVAIASALAGQFHIVGS